MSFLLVIAIAAHVISLLGLVLITVFAAYSYCCADMSAMNLDVIAPDIELGLPTNPTPVNTRQELERNNFETVYKRKESGGDDGGVVTEECCICLEEFNDGECCTILSCKHTYHRACIKVWLRVNKHCPMCRESVRGRFIKGDDSSTMHQILVG